MAPVTYHNVKDYQVFKKLVDDLLAKNALVFGWFVGTEENGKSWCPDCRDAKPIIHEHISKLEVPNNTHVIYTQIDKDVYWLADCPYRIDTQIKLKQIPTILYLNGRRRLTEGDCLSNELLSLFFEESIRRYTNLHKCGDNYVRKR